MTTEATKSQYRIRNWREYNEALKQRGSLTFWIDDEVLDGWLNTTQTGKRGASATYSDLAIATMSTMGSVMHLRGRQTEGFMTSLFQLMGVTLPVPDHSTVSRRLGKLSIALPVVEGRGGAPCSGRFDRHQSVRRRGMEGAPTRLQQASHLAETPFGGG